LNDASGNCDISCTTRFWYKISRDDKKVPNTNDDEDEKAKVMMRNIYLYPKRRL